jgi:HlyD family secretion protein
MLNPQNNNKKRNSIIAGSAVVVLLLAYLMFGRSSASKEASILGDVKRGQFRIEIETTGELEAKNSVKIQGPSTLRNFRINNVTIQSIVDEGTRVKKGDWVASLDPSEFRGRFDDKRLELEGEQSEFNVLKLDTLLLLREARDNLINLKYAVEEKKIVLDQSKFEPPATIKQAEIDFKKAERAYEQALENYKIKQRQNVEKTRDHYADLRKVQNEYNMMDELSKAFQIQAPEDGMVIYMKGWDGKPVKAGSQVNLWDPTVATLPDLSRMISKTYVNEVDVRTVRPGQKVEIGLDAYPDKKLSGVVTRVANVGEQLANSDAKVFQVDVEIKGSDESLRPAMTTSNKIIASVVEDALYISLESLHSFADSVTYVFKKEGGRTTKQEVMIGETNANDAIILAGLSEGEVVYLSVPPGMDADDIGLIPEMNGKRKKPEAVTPNDPEEMMAPGDDQVIGGKGQREGQGGRQGQGGARSRDRQLR